MSQLSTFLKWVILLPVFIIAAPLLLPILMIRWLGTKVNPPVSGFRTLSASEADQGLLQALEGTGFRLVEREEDIGVFGLDPRYRLRARGPLGGSRTLRTGDLEFDDAVELSTQIPYEYDEERGPIGVFRGGELRRYRGAGRPVDDLDLLSRLDHRCRTALKQRIERLSVEDGQLHGELEAFREETFGFSPGPTAWLPICEALRYKPSSTLEERLWALVTTDPDHRVRCTVFQRWVAHVNGANEAEQDVPALLGRLLGEAVTEVEVIALLEQPERVEALAAIHWLSSHGGAQCMAGLARFLNAEESSEQGKKVALRVLDRLQKQFGAVAGGGVSLVAEEEAGALSVVEDAGGVSLAEESAAKKARGALATKKPT